MNTFPDSAYRLSAPEVSAGSCPRAGQDNRQAGAIVVSLGFRLPSSTGMPFPATCQNNRSAAATAGDVRLLALVRFSSSDSRQLIAFVAMICWVRRSWREDMDPGSVDDESEGVAFGCRNLFIEAHGEGRVEMQECFGAERFDVIEAGDEVRLSGPRKPQ